MAGSTVPKLLFPRPSPVPGSLPKWQLALVVGTPIALGLGYMYYKNYVGKPEEESNGDKPKRSTKENGVKQISIDGDCSTEFENVTDNETLLQKAQRLKTQGNKFFNLGKFDEAINQYTIAIDTCPPENTDELATFYQNRAAAYEKLKKYNAVGDDCTKALELKPRYIKALKRRARVLEIKKDFETALEDITAACILENYKNQNTLYTADTILKQLGKQHADEYMATKEVVMPSKYFMKMYFNTFQNDPLLKDKDPLPDENMLSYKKALAAVWNQEYDDVIPLCIEELSNLGADDESIQKMKVILLRGTFYFLLSQYDKALEDLSTVIDSEVSSMELKVNAYIKRAITYLQLENPDKTIIDFRHAELLNPRCPDIYYYRAQLYLFIDHFKEAKEDYDRAIELNPDCSIAYGQKIYTDYRCAVAEKDMNLVNESIKNLITASEKFPNCQEICSLYARVFADTRDFSQAELYYDKAFKLDPSNVSILIYRGLLQWQWKNDIDKTVEYIEQAIEIDDKSAFAYETLGTIEVHRNNLKEAVALFDKALTYSRGPVDLIHIFSLRDAAKAQLVVSQRFADLLQDKLIPRSVLKNMNYPLSIEVQRD